MRMKYKIVAAKTENLTSSSRSTSSEELKKATQVKTIKEAVALIQNPPVDIKFFEDNLVQFNDKKSNFLLRASGILDHIAKIRHECVDSNKSLTARTVDKKTITKNIDRIAAVVIRGLILKAAEFDREQESSKGKSQSYQEQIFSILVNRTPEIWRSNPVLKKYLAGTNGLGPEVQTQIKGFVQDTFAGRKIPQFLKEAHFYKKGSTRPFKPKKKLPYAPITAFTQLLHHIFDGPKYPFNYFDYLIRQFTRATTYAGKEGTDLKTVGPYLMNAFTALEPFLSDWQLSNVYEHSDPTIRTSKPPETKHSKPRKKPSKLASMLSLTPRSPKITLYTIQTFMLERIRKKRAVFKTQAFARGIQCLNAFLTLALQDKTDHGAIDEGDRPNRKLQQLWGSRNKYWWDYHQAIDTIDETGAIPQSWNEAVELPVTLFQLACFYYQRAFLNNPVPSKFEDVRSYLEPGKREELQQAGPWECTALYVFTNTVQVYTTHLINHQILKGDETVEKWRKGYYQGFAVPTARFFGMGESKKHVAGALLHTILDKGLYTLFKGRLTEIRTCINRLIDPHYPVNQLLQQWNAPYKGGDSLIGRWQKTPRVLLKKDK